MTELFHDLILAVRIGVAAAGLLAVSFILIGIAWGEAEWRETRREADLQRNLQRARELDGQYSPDPSDPDHWHWYKVGSEADNDDT